LAISKQDFYARLTGYCEPDGGLLARLVRALSETALSQPLLAGLSHSRFDLHGTTDGFQFIIAKLESMTELTGICIF